MANSGLDCKKWDLKLLKSLFYFSTQVILWLSNYFRMSCVVPGCKSGYGFQSKLPEGVRKHRFPKYPVFRAIWRKAIPRESWEPTDSSIICSLHFQDSDYVTERQDNNQYRSQGPLKLKRLKPEAIPRRFPGTGGPRYWLTVRTCV